MRIYIAGVIAKGGTLSGSVVLENIERFYKEAARLRAEGYDVVNPVELHGTRGTEAISHQAWADYLRRDIAELVMCDGIRLLPGWEDSRGARLEEHIARELGLEVIE